MKQTLNSAVEPEACREFLEEARRLNADPTENEYVQLILSRCAVDARFFCRVFLAETFSHRDSWQHEEVWRLINDEQIPRVCIMAWRGFGKTTVSIGKAIHSILFRHASFVMVVGSSEVHATEITETMKGELLENDLIRYCFGDLQASDIQGELRKRFSKAAWMVYSPATGKSFAGIVPKGAGQRVRGLQMRIGGKVCRPDMIIVDDVEDDEEVYNEEIRHKRRTWFNGALKECTPKQRPSARTGRWIRSQESKAWRPPWRIIYLDTLKHQDANIAHIMQSTDWKSVTFPMASLRQSPPAETDEKFRSYEYTDDKPRYYSEVSELVSTAQVRKEIDTAKADGVFDTYCMEKLCLPIPPEGANWTQDSFKYYSETERRMNKDTDLVRFILVDPAKNPNPRSAYSALLACAADPDAGVVYLRRLINRKMEFTELSETLFMLARDTNTGAIGVEVTGLEGIIMNLLRGEMQRARMSLTLVPLESRGVGAKGDFGNDKHSSKRARIAGFAPWYRRGAVYHEESLKGSFLERELLQYPKCKYWDAVDAAAYVPEMLQKLNVFMQFKQPVESDEMTANEIDYHDLGRRIRQRDWTLA